MISHTKKEVGNSLVRTVSQFFCIVEVLLYYLDYFLCLRLQKCKDKCIKNLRNCFGCYVCLFMLRNFDTCTAALISRLKCAIVHWFSKRDQRLSQWKEVRFLKMQYHDSQGKSSFINFLQNSVLVQNFKKKISFTTSCSERTLFFRSW